MLASLDLETLQAILAGDASPGLAGRRFLIVTAPFGPFSKELARAIRQRGGLVTRMLFNAGDLMDWGHRDVITFHEPARAWPRRFAGLLHEFTDFIVFGEGGPYNQAVIAHAGALDARIWVLENGYFRPHWITVERNGVNARSNLPSTPLAYQTAVPESAVQFPAGKILPHHVINLSLYHLIQLPGRLLFPQYERTYTYAPWLQCAGHIRRYFALMVASRRAVKADVIRARGPFFLVGLQREGDATILRYSPYKTNEAFLEAVMDSFAAHGLEGDRLVVKNHPLDPGLINYRAMVRRMAEARGLKGRVDFIDGGNLAQLCRASRGMIVNNSTAALAALGFHTPSKVVGAAFFDFEGLTDQQPLDAFWKEPHPADEALFARFRAHVIARTQVNGNYHEPAARERTARSLVAVFEAAV